MTPGLHIPAGKLPRPDPSFPVVAVEGPVQANDERRNYGCQDVDSHEYLR